MRVDGRPRRDEQRLEVNQPWQEPRDLVGLMIDGGMTARQAAARALPHGCERLQRLAPGTRLRRLSPESLESGRAGALLSQRQPWTKSISRTAADQLTGGRSRAGVPAVISAR